jgi:cyclin-dependent kinase
VSELELNNETVQAGWVSALGRVLRTEELQHPHTNRPPLGITAEQIRQMVTRLPEARASWPEDEVQKLVVLGFARQEALAALNATDGNVEMAAGFLFEHYPQ